MRGILLLPLSYPTILLEYERLSAMFLAVQQYSYLLSEKRLEFILYLVYMFSLLVSLVMDATPHSRKYLLAAAVFFRIVSVSLDHKVF